jgi:hypothetical protein
MTKLTKHGEKHEQHEQRGEVYEIRPGPSAREKLRFGLLIVAFGAILLFPVVSTMAAEHEPTEKEMLGAVKAKFDQINANLRNLQQQCEAREFQRQNNPLLAMQCLQLYGASGGNGDLAYKITRFEKIGCEKAMGQAGAVCDYSIGFASNSPYAQGVLNQLTGGGSAGQGRFISRDNGWLFLPMDKRR